MSRLSGQSRETIGVSFSRQELQMRMSSTYMINGPSEEWEWRNFKRSAAACYSSCCLVQCEIWRHATANNRPQPHRKREEQRASIHECRAAVVPFSITKKKSKSVGVYLSEPGQAKLMSDGAQVSAWGTEFSKVDAGEWGNRDKICISWKVPPEAVLRIKYCVTKSRRIKRVVNPRETPPGRECCFCIPKLGE